MIHRSQIVRSPTSERDGSEDVRVREDGGRRERDGLPRPERSWPDPAAAAVWGNDVRTDIGSLASRYRVLGAPHLLLLNALRTHGFTHTREIARKGPPSDGGGDGGVGRE